MSSSPKSKEWRLENLEKYRSYQREYMRKYRNRPEQVQYRKMYYQRPEVIERKNDPEIKKNLRKYSETYRSRRRVKKYKNAKLLTEVIINDTTHKLYSLTKQDIQDLTKLEATIIQASKIREMKPNTEIYITHNIRQTNKHHDFVSLRICDSITKKRVGTLHIFGYAKLEE